MRASLGSACVVSLAILAAACGGSEPPPHERAAAATRADANPPTTPTANAPAAPRSPATNRFTPPTAKQLERSKLALQGHLDAGRAAIAAQDPPTGIAQLQAAAAINPTQPTISRELGWAQLEAGQLDQAQATLDRALHHATDLHTRAAIEFELGRVAEARADIPVATEHYTKSLELRPNELVAARLTTLTGGTEVISHSECGWIDHGPAPAHLCPAYLRTLAPGDPPPTCAYEHSAAGESGPVTVYDLELDGASKVAVFSYLEHGAGGSREIFVLNAVLDQRWYTSELTWVDHPEVGYADENLADLQLRTEQLAPGGLPELVIEWSVQGHAIDPGANIETTWSVDRLGVLMLQSGTPRWLIGLTRAAKTRSATIAGDGPPELRTRSVELEWLTKTGQVELRAGDHEPSAPIGTFALGAAPQLCPAELAGH
ncbi:INTEGRAL MEMBRANE PROTEIN (Rhomboid family) [Enhygromyxa salina]|uniref:INTEGRAL MEMBRANE PROTEIN (Rhomboid family) n=1 Tax=Enhygromyxa salina TaxID=215803 RepID=A0A0C2DGQ9_9BACT|nr:tetratricopeptide repeat protein [Enhygromyxa salina]KIG18852.1 INTEGRAL MEMBRANE PROTEIN (Rhomboid family) [Enhygromyxa salina]